MDHKTALFWSKSEQSPQTGTHPPPPYHGYGKHPKRQSTHRPASPCTAVQEAIGAVFFRRSRLFLREAAFSSGGEGCEWGAQQPTVGESGDKAENAFSGFVLLAVPRKGFSPHIPAPRLFVHFHPSKSHSSSHPLFPYAFDW